jgi:hypothetical protein
MNESPLTEATLLECIALGNLGLVSDAQGLGVQARQHLDTALRIAREIGDRRSEGQFLGHLGLAAGRAGDAAAGRALLAEAATTLTALGDRVSLGLVHCQCAELEALVGAAAASARARAEAEAVAQACDAGPRSELGVAQARLAVVS